MLYKRYLIKVINLKIIDNNTVHISIFPRNYENYYLWNSLLEDVLNKITYSKHVIVSFSDEQLCNIFVGFMEECSVKPTIAKFDVAFNSCNKRVINELIYSYDFFDYSYAFSIIVKEYKKEYCVSPLGDNLGIEIKCSDGYDSVVSMIENVCCDYDVILEKDNKNE